MMSRNSTVLALFLACFFASATPLARSGLNSSGAEMSLRRWSSVVCMHLMALPLSRQFDIVEGMMATLTAGDPVQDQLWYQLQEVLQMIAERMLEIQLNEKQ